MNFSPGWKTNSLRTGKTAVLGVLVSVALLATACYDIKSGRVDVGGSINFTLPAFPETGSHAVVVWSEMHYQPSYRVQEGPRLLPPDGSVPVSGAEIVPTSMEEYEALDIPSDYVARYDSASAEHLYQVNCLVCHGAALDGNGPITTLKRADGTDVYSRGPFPANLTADATTGATDGELFGFVSGGGRQGLSLRLRGRESASPMPEFGKLLTEEERWAIVQYMRSRTGQ